MPRKKRSFRRERRGLKLVGGQIILTCYECNLQRHIDKDKRDTDEILDIEAPGWYTLLSGISLCPNCTSKQGLTHANIHPLTETIYGDPGTRREEVARYLDRTRRRMELARWKSATSEDSMTSEIS